MIADDLWSDLKAVVREDQVVYTLGQQRKANRIHNVGRQAISISTEHSGGGPEEVPAWMFNTAWDALKRAGSLRASDLQGPVLNVKRSSAVCAILALLPRVEVASARPIELKLLPPDPS